VLVVPASFQDQGKSGKTFLSALEKGQVIALKEVAGRYEIRVLKDLVVGHTVVVVGLDYVVIEDVGGIAETRIPVYSIKAIVRMMP